LAFGELGAFRALRGGEVPPWWTRLMEIAIGAAIGLLILVPAIEFVAKGNAEGVARMITGAWLPRWRLFLVERRLLRAHRLLHAQRHERWLLLNQLEGAVSAIKGTVSGFTTLIARYEAAANGASDSPPKEILDHKEVLEEKLCEANALLLKTTQEQADALRAYRQMISEELEIDSAFRLSRMNARRLVSEARVEDRHRVVRDILAETTYRTGTVGYLHESGLFERVDPDDGGFLPLRQIGKSAQNGDSAAAYGGEPRSLSRGKRQYAGNG
jgi:hypothetical protein